MNRVLITGRLTRDPELRTTAGGKAVAQFSVASHQYVSGKEMSEFHNVVVVGPAGRDVRPVPRQGPAGRRRGPDPDALLGRRQGRAPLEDRDRRQQRRDAVRAGGRRTTPPRPRPPRSRPRRRPRASRPTPPSRSRTRPGSAWTRAATTRRTRRTSSSRRPWRPPDHPNAPPGDGAAPPPAPSPLSHHGPIEVAPGQAGRQPPPSRAASLRGAPPATSRSTSARAATSSAVLAPGRDP